MKYKPNYKILSSVALGSLIVPFAQSEDTTIKKPNILFILVDDLGWNDISCMGSTFYETPNVDRIARNGVKFTQGYAASSVSSPSRASILTGKTPPLHGITSWIGDPHSKNWRKYNRHTKMLPATYQDSINKTEYTIAHALSDAGYATFFFGKWHLGDNVSPVDYGFDINVGGWGSGSPNGGYFSPYNNPKLSDGEKGENLTMRLSDEVIAQIKQLKKQDVDKPFFTLLSFYAVHGQIQTTRERWDYYRQKAISQGLEEDGFYNERVLPTRKRQDNPVYAGLIEQMDLAVGNILDYLENSGLLNNTIVVFTSDNGGVVSGDSYSTSLRPLRGGKGTQWEGGIRVPFLIWNPQLDINTSVVNEPVISMDLYPTLLEMVDVSINPKQKIDGLSLLPLLGDSVASFERPLFWHYPHYGNQGGEPSSIVRDGDWKLIYYHEDGHYELYNLSEDLGEQTDLANIHTDKKEELITKLQSWLKNTNAQMPTVDPLYNVAKEQIVRQDRMDRFKSYNETLRKEQFSKSWTPNATWWESE